jgi:hypothetical protein
MQALRHSLATLRLKLAPFARFNRQRKSRATALAGRDVTYFPPFRCKEDLVNHFCRARWYIPQSRCSGHVFFGKLFAGVWRWTESDVPEPMARTPYPTRHLRVVGLFGYLRSLFVAGHILQWRGDAPSLGLMALRALTGATITVVTTDSLAAIEYGRYCDFTWRNLVSERQRDAILEENSLRFRSKTAAYRDRRRVACVFGTGPSLDKAYDLDFTDVLCVVCNSIVQNPRLLDHIRPQFITAGDVVSHFGISLYADQFRRDLIDCLAERDMFFVTTAPFGLLLVEHYPTVRDRVFLFVQQNMGISNFDLIREPFLPTLDSTLNIHMLPLASTFRDTIYILGCDGKDPDASKNEDFWSHSPSAQYHDLVETGHRCHPTFDVHRKARTYCRYQDSTRQTLEEGERSHGKKYFSLAPSFIPEIQERCVDVTKHRPPISVGELASFREE